MLSPYAMNFDNRELRRLVTVTANETWQLRLAAALVATKHHALSFRPQTRSEDGKCTF